MRAIAWPIRLRRAEPHVGLRALDSDGAGGSPEKVSNQIRIESRMWKNGQNRIEINL